MQNNFKVKQDKVIEHFGGLRETMTEYLKHLEEVEFYEFAAHVRDCIAKYDAGDIDAFKEYID